MFQIDIETSLVRHVSERNTVEISVTREREVLLMYDEHGNIVTVGSNTSPPFPNPKLLLTNIVSFDPHDTYPLLYSTLQDPILCSRLSDKIASEAEQSVSEPLYISLHVTLTPHRFLLGGVSDDEEGKKMETCAICLKEEKKDLLELLNCSHMFHDHCITEWLCRSNTCPICRAVVLDDDDDHPYYSETESS